MKLLIAALMLLCMHLADAQVGPNIMQPVNINRPIYIAPAPIYPIYPSTTNCVYITGVYGVVTTVRCSP